MLFWIFCYNALVSFNESRPWAYKLCCFKLLDDRTWAMSHREIKEKDEQRSEERPSQPKLFNVKVKLKSMSRSWNKSNGHCCGALIHFPHSRIVYFPVCLPQIKITLHSHSDSFNNQVLKAFPVFVSKYFLPLVRGKKRKVW